MAMPQLGESVTEGTISQWLVSVGDEVKKYDPIAEVTTDKVNADIPSSFSGKITALLVGEGDTLPVGEPICAIEVEGTEPAIEKLAKSTSAARNLTETEQQDTSMKKRYSPAVLRLAQEHNIDLETLEGTGRSGRITRKDVEQYIASGQAADKIQKKEETTSEQPGAACFSEAVAKAASSKPTPAPRQYQNEAGDHVVALTGVRRAIATNMVRSKHEIPHAWTMIEVDVTNLVNYRNQIKGTFLKKEGHKLTYLPFFIKAIVAALKEFPRINSTWAGDKIIEKKAVNISL
ncbi:MAG: 2-oxo acid dehydrogenase subunit, partial [Sporolactobacillus laevolacticus]|nr:2-oxo acid dehydrogenase subunit [Sporolactobacillus laevolacticus]